MRMPRRVYPAVLASVLLPAAFAAAALPMASASGAAAPARKPPAGAPAPAEASLKPDYEMAKKLARELPTRDAARKMGIQILPGLVALVETGNDRINQDSQLLQWQYAASLLGVIGDKRAAPFLAARVGLEHTGLPEWYVVEPMGKLGVKEIVPYLIHWLQKYPYWQVNSQAYGSHANYMLEVLQELTGKDFGAKVRENVDYNFTHRKEILAAVKTWWAAEGEKQYGRVAAPTPAQANASRSVEQAFTAVAVRLEALANDHPVMTGAGKAIPQYGCDAGECIRSARFEFRGRREPGHDCYVCVLLATPAPAWWFSKRLSDGEEAKEYRIGAGTYGILANVVSDDAKLTKVIRAILDEEFSRAAKASTATAPAEAKPAAEAAKNYAQAIKCYEKYVAEFQTADRCAEGGAMKTVHEVFDHALKMETKSPEVKEKNPPPVE